MKVLIDDIAEFMNSDDGWPEPSSDWYYDADSDSPLETMLNYNGTSLYFPKQRGEMVTLEDFECDVCYQGDDPKKKGTTHSLIKLFKRWRSKKDNETFLCYIPKKLHPQKPG